MESFENTTHLDEMHVTDTVTPVSLLDDSGRNRLTVLVETNDVLNQMRSTVAFVWEVHTKNLFALMTNLDLIIKSIEENLTEYEQRNMDHMCIPAVAEEYDNIVAVSKQIPSVWEQNDLILRNLIHLSDIKLRYTILDSQNSHDIQTDFTESQSELHSEQQRRHQFVASYDSIQQSIGHINRDWSVGGRQVRRILYLEGIVEAVSRYISLLRRVEGYSSAQTAAQSSPRILVPGAGAGRLAFELACRGYMVESNEVSPSMVAIVVNLYQSILPQIARDRHAVNSFQHWYPYLASALIDEWDFSQRIQPVPLIDAEDIGPILDWISLVNENRSESFYDRGMLKIQYGDFLSLYDRPSRHGTFECIVTSFFIDTADDVIQYIRVIRALLVEGGYWINAGPLHYHNFNIDKAKAARSRTSIPYSYAAIINIAKKLGFVVISNRRIEATYSGEHEVSMKPDFYDMALTVFQFTKYPPTISRQPTSSLSPSSDWPHPEFILL